MPVTRRRTSDAPGHLAQGQRGRRRRPEAPAPAGRRSVGGPRRGGHCFLTSPLAIRAWPLRARRPGAASASHDWREHRGPCRGRGMLAVSAAAWLWRQQDECRWAVFGARRPRPGRRPPDHLLLRCASPHVRRVPRELEPASETKSAGRVAGEDGRCVRAGALESVAAGQGCAAEVVVGKPGARRAATRAGPRQRCLPAVPHETSRWPARRGGQIRGLPAGMPAGVSAAHGDP